MITNEEKGFLKGLFLGVLGVVLLVIAFGDYVPAVVRMIWPNSAKFKNIPVHEDSIFDEHIVGEIPHEQFSKTHVCEIWNGEQPAPMSGIFTYDIVTESWIWCQ